MSSTKLSAQQCTTTSSSRSRNIITTTTTTTTKKHHPLINVSASANNNTPRLARSTPPSHAAISRTITYTSTTVNSRRQGSSVVSDSPSRVPLQTRDRNQNVRPMTTTTRPSSCVSAATSSLSSTRSTKMPPMGGGNDRPRQPQLAAKPLRPPLTPKVASKPSHSQPVTPLGRRAPPVQTPTVASISNSKEDTASPLAPFLAHNITPRSGSRQSRVESTSTTPSGTPVPERASDGWSDSPKLSGLGVSVPASDNSRSSLQGSAVGEPADSKFFYASDARSAQTSTTSRPTSTVNKSPPTFFYANGTTATSSQQPQNPPNPIYSSNTAATSEPSVSKFFYANGVPDVSARGGIATPGAGSTISGTSRVPHTRPTTSNSATPPTIPPILSRPASPTKAASNPSTHTLRNNASSPTPSLAPPSLAPAPRNVGFRRDSLESSSHRASRGHSRTGSIPTIDTVAATRLTQSPTSPGPASPLPSPAMTQPALTIATIMQAVEAIGEEDESRTGETPELQSPNKSVNNDPISDLVMNARRERKVQDLEITNASLEAINRTLERQLRKQTAELRRYRRLSRSGRLSLASVASSRVTSGASTIQGGLPDLSEEEFSDEDQDSYDDEDDLSSSESRSTDGPLSPDTRILARRKRDEKRLQLDLTKHQELLVDSQKINQSLKRCLDWTEVLIKEGKKALDYTVRVSEVELGGRVLAPLDEDEDEETSFLDQIAAEGGSSRATSPSQAPPLAIDDGREILPLEEGE